MLVLLITYLEESVNINLECMNDSLRNITLKCLCIMKNIIQLLML